MRSPAHIVKRGKTPLLSADDARKLLDSIPLTRSVRLDGREIKMADLVGLRDRAVIAMMGYGFTRVSAVVGMNVEAPRTTKLYDRTADEITLDEVERIRI